MTTLQQTTELRQYIVTLLCLLLCGCVSLNPHKVTNPEQHYSITNSVADLTALFKSATSSIRVKETTNLIRTFVVPAKSKDKLWWIFLNAKGQSISMPTPNDIETEFVISRKETLTSPWIVFTKTNQPPVTVITRGFYKIEWNDK